MNEASKRSRFFQNGWAFSVFLKGSILFAPCSLWAHTGSWNVDANGSWTNAANWTSSPNYPGDQGTADVATFGNVISANRTITLTGTIKINSVTFNSTNQYTLTGGTLQLNSSGVQTFQQGSGGVVINSAIVLQQSVNEFGGAGTGIVTLNGVISAPGNKGLTLSATNTTFILNANNTYVGPTVISAGTVQLNATGSLGGTSSVTINSGGTLLMTGASTDRINNSADIALSGGVITANDSTETMGVLTLTANSVINLSAGGSQGSLTFANTSWSPGTSTLTVNNWTGSAYVSGTDDRIFFSASMAGQLLSGIQFTGFGPGAFVLSTGEVVPVPEPATVLGGLLLLGLIGCRSLKISARTA